MLKSTSSRCAVLILVALLGLAVLLISVVPISRIDLGTRPSAGATTALVERAAYIHFALHVFVFGVLAWVVWLAVSFAAPGAASRLIALSLITILGWTSEYLQHRFYHNPVEVSDVIVDASSATAVFGIFALWTRWRKLATKRDTDRETISLVPDLD